MSKKPVAVICDLAGTFDNGWTGAQPAWMVEPESLKCRKGNHSIIWSLTAQNVPKGFDAAFVDPGVVFKLTPPWPGGTPKNKPNGKVTATNDVPALGNTIKYSYTTVVAVTPNPGTPYPGQTFSYDPDVENEPGGGDGDDGKPATRKKARRAAKPKAKAKARPKAKKVQKASKAKKKTKKAAKRRAGKKR